MLDWGGGIGHYYFLARALWPDLQIEYACKDVPLLAEYGATLFPDQHFSSGEDCLSGKYDLVMASASLQYEKDWKNLLHRLANASSKYMYIAQLPTIQKSPSFVFVQRPYQYGYNTEYLAWCINEAEFLAASRSAGLRLVRKFVYGYQPKIFKAPEQNIYSGYLFTVDREERS